MKNTYQLMAINDCRKSFYGKAIVTEHRKDGETSWILQSYATNMIVFSQKNSGEDYGTLQLLSTANSQTTRRHVKEFLQQNLGDKVANLAYKIIFSVGNCTGLPAIEAGKTISVATLLELAH